MKKITGLLFLLLLMVTGCGKVNKESIVNEFKSKINKAKSYEVDGNMKIYSDEDIYEYKINAKHYDDDYYKISLLNKTNDHEQIILKNEDGVYVVTPSLNKSFKFQSNWPNNSSQSYLLECILKDIENDQNTKFAKVDKNYVLTSKVNYPNNEELSYEKIYFKKNKDLEKIEIFTKDNKKKILVNFDNINYRASLDEDDFKLEDLISTSECINCTDDEKVCDNCDNNKEQDTTTTNDKEETTSKLEDIIYPLYVPENTSLSTKDVISTEDGQRAILTFSGDNSFILVEETARVSDEFEVIPVYGDPEIINDTIGALGKNSVSWTSNKVNYYLTGTNLSKKELKNVAESINNMQAVIKEK